MRNTRNAVKWRTSQIIVQIPQQGCSGAGKILFHKGNNLRDATLVSANTGTLVCDYGTIVGTSDGGNNWSVQSSGTTEPCGAFHSQIQIAERPVAHSFGEESMTGVGARAD